MYIIILQDCTVHVRVLVGDCVHASPFINSQARCLANSVVIYTLCVPTVCVCMLRVYTHLHVHVCAVETDRLQEDLL